MKSNNFNLYDVEESCKLMGNLLGLDKPVTTDVLLGAAKDSTYAHNLFVCKKTPAFLEHLLENPPGLSDKSSSKFDLLEEANKIIDEWSRVESINGYSKRYEEYLKEDSMKYPGAKPCGCEDVKIDVFREVYLDNNATTDIRPEVREILNKYYAGEYGFANPSSNTLQGNDALKLISDSRKKIARCIGAENNEIIFTGSGSESNNLAIKGIAFANMIKKGHIITTKVEHASVIKTVNYLETLGFTATYLDTDSIGAVSPEAVKKALTDDTILVSVMAGNNEIGTINPIKEIGSLCSQYKIPFMVDAIQAFGKIPLDVKEMGISILTFSGHKIYVPKGIGGIYIEKGLEIIPLVHGGGQEMGIRSGTENVGYIIALGEAALIAHKGMEAETERLNKLTDFFLEELAKVEPGFIINGPLKDRLPGNINIGFPGVDSAVILKSLNKVGICVSAGSACSSGNIKGSHVLEAIGADTGKYASIRFSMGRDTTTEDIKYLMNYMKQIFEKVKKDKA